MLFRKEIERCNFAINYKFGELINTKEFIDSNFDFVSIITKKKEGNSLVDYKKTTEPNSMIKRSHGGLIAGNISYYYKNNRINYNNRNYLLASLNLTLFHKFSRLEDCLNRENNASKI